MIFNVGWALIGMAFVLVSYSLFPVKLFDPIWQLKLLTVVLGNLDYMLIGALLVCFGSREATLNSRIFRQARLLRSLASWFSLALFLAIPLQFSAGIQAINNEFYSNSAALRRMSEGINKIANTKSEQELRNVLQSFANRSPLPPKFDRPFSEVKAKLVEQSTYNMKTTSNRLILIRNSAMQASFAESIRNGVFMLLAGMGFAWIGMSDPGHTTVISTIFNFFQFWQSKRLWFVNRSRSSPSFEKYESKDSPDSKINPSSNKTRTSSRSRSKQPEK
jgi:hypothetical protein